MATLNSEKSLALLRFLRDCSALRRKRVARYEPHERILWFSQVPYRPPECRSVFFREDPGGALLHVRKTRMPPRPPIPEAFRDLLRADQLDDPREEPVFTPSRREREELAAAWNSYLTGAWRPWATRMKAWREVQRVYEEVDYMRRRLVEADERFELVVAVGFLQWRDASRTEIQRHLLSAPAEIHFDPSRGELTVEVVGPLRLELDMLAFHDQPKLDWKTLEPRITELDPWHRESAMEVLRIVANQTSATAELYDDAMEPQGQPDETLRVFYAPALVLRERRPNAYDEVIQKLIELASSGREIATTAPWERFLAEGETEEAAPGQVLEVSVPPGFVDRRVYFPLPTNDEQRAIIERLKSQPYVLVKGPPGTGKSLTIANLICHLLASGERVLVTAQAPKALAVLKDLLPEEVRKLCVNAIGSTRDQESFLEESVRGIIARKENWQGGGWAENRMRRLENELRELEIERSKVERRLREMREAETARHNVGGGYDGTAAEIAKKVDARRERFGWMPELAAGAAQCPLHAEEIAFLAEVHGKFSAERVKELSLELGDFELPEPAAFAEVLERLETAERLFETARTRAPRVPVEAVSSLPDEAVEGAGQVLAEFDEGIARLTLALGAAADEVIADLVAGRGGRWRQLAAEASALAQQMLARRGKIGTSRVDIPQGVDRRQLLADARRRLEHFERGGRRSWGVFTPRTVSETAYVEARCYVDGSPVESPAALAKVVAYLELSSLLDEFTHLVCELQVEVDQQHLLRGVQDAAAFAEDLERFVRVLDGPAKALLGHLPVHERLALIRREERDRLRASVELERAWRLVSREKQRLASWQRAIKSLPADRRHPCMERFAEAIESRDPGLWAAAHRERQALLDERAEYSRYEQLLAALGAACPGLPALLRETQGQPEWKERLLQLREAWAWAAARDWLKRRISVEEYQALGREWHRLQERILKKTEELAGLKAWRAFFARLDDATQQSLIAWSAAVERIGRDKGKFSFVHRRTAREYLSACIPKIPAWIMPLHRLWATVDPEPGVFDTIIIDEASQAGLDSLVLFLLGKRIIVVGDDKQNSPEAVGIREDDVTRLAWDHLRAFRFRDEFRLDSSLFDHALRTFGNPITLREHFRCVPEIIEFSNDLCYQENPLIPLKEPPPRRLSPLRATYVEGASCEGKGPRIINRKEAEALVDALVKCLQDEAYEGKTMGVIVLQGHAQVQLIEEMLVRRIDPRVRELRKIHCGVPATFQGDERDVIFLSLVIAPNHEYRALTNLPEQRRFNVAMSRAREQVWLFHSVRADELSPECLRYRLLQHFDPRNRRVRRHFYESRYRLEREAREAAREKEMPPDPYESWFEVDVALELLRRNYRIRPHYRVVDRAIDIVVEGEDRRLAVECDGGEWHGPEEYDRELARQRQLERAGWTFVRLRESEFYADRERAIERVVEACELLGIHPVGRRIARGGEAGSAAAGRAGSGRLTRGAGEKGPGDEAGGLGRAPLNGDKVARESEGWLRNRTAQPALRGRPDGFEARGQQPADSTSHEET